MEDTEGRIDEIIRILLETYPDCRTALYHSNPLEILVATILSAQCTDKKVNEITPGLFAKYPTAADFAAADPAKLEEEIRPTGFYRNKTRSIIGAARRIEDDFEGRVPDTMEDLITLPGVARKTANIVLSSGFRKAEGIAVDTHVKRLSGRLGLSREKDPDKIEQDLLQIVPRSAWLDFNYLLVNHGRALCPARKPRCTECPLAHLCPSAALGSGTRETGNEALRVTASGRTDRSTKEEENFMNGCHLGLISNNPADLIRFYTEKLGFTEGESHTIPLELVRSIFGLPAECRMTKLHRGLITLEVFAPQGVELSPRTDDQAGYNHFGLWTEDKERFCAELAEQGVEVIKSPYQDRFVYFVKDPEGNRVDIFER